MKKKKKKFHGASSRTSGTHVHVTVNPTHSVHVGSAPMQNEADRSLERLHYKPFKG